MVSQPAPVWKQEVNRRLAAHKSRKSSSATEPQTPSANRPGADSRAALAAARVMARYAKTPSFSELQAAEARAAKRVPQSAPQARAPIAPVPAPAPVLAASYEAAVEQETEPAPVLAPEPAACVAEPAIAEPVVAAPAMDTPAPLTAEAPAPEVRWEQEIPPRPAEFTAIRETSESRANGWREPISVGSLAIQAVDPVEPDQPIHANLIEFPRELVAARKVRPRLAEGPFARAEAASSQLSIFEVDPATISNEPEPSAAPAIATYEWSGIRLDAQPEPEEEIELLDEPAPAVATIELAPLSRRLLAAVMDGTLISGAFVGASWAALSHMEQLPALKAMEVAGSVALMGTAGLYMLLFSVLAAGTPGMKYAGISLCTFDDQIPTPTQRCARLGAFVLSLLPVGLGFAWSVFDENHLSWHDRLSKTYQRH